MKQGKDLRPLVLYLARFLGIFCLLFYGTEAVIGLSAPGHHYSPFVAQHLDFITPFRRALLTATKALLSLFGYPASFRGDVIILQGGAGVRMSYSCIGYGVLSFWISFVLANRGTWRRKTAWMILGAGLLCAINIARVGLLVLAVNRNWVIPFGWDHHTWFNLAAYALIFFLVYGFDRSSGKLAQPNAGVNIDTCHSPATAKNRLTPGNPEPGSTPHQVVKRPLSEALNTKKPT